MVVCVCGWVGVGALLPGAGPGAAPSSSCVLPSWFEPRRLPRLPCLPHALPHALLPPAAGYVLKCMLSPDVRQLATTSSDKTVKLWNLDGFTLDRTLAGAHAWTHGAELRGGAVASPPRPGAAPGPRRQRPSHRRFPPSRHARRSCAPVFGAGHQRWVWDCVFSVDAAYLVTASSDCTARLW